MGHYLALCLVIAIFVFVLLALLSFSPQSQASTQLAAQAVNGKIAFVSDNTIYTINADGSGILQLTSDGQTKRRRGRRTAAK